MANKKHTSRRTRRIAVKDITCDTVEQRKVCVMCVEIQEQYADIFTKPLDLKTFAKHAGALMNAELHD